MINRIAELRENLKKHEVSSADYQNKLEDRIVYLERKLEGIVESFEDQERYYEKRELWDYKDAYRLVARFVVLALNDVGRPKP
ncbi:hypothetical protein M0R04_09235 [Candidatus Dojkabacteria bacterium]|jgi:hypothetical protein|nr:hypothetical protein [Candidatus Dojkabacteria bacterium]